MLELENHIVFLPSKYDYISDDHIKDLSKGGYCIKKEPNNNNNTNNSNYYKIVFEKKQ